MKRLSAHWFITLMLGVAVLMLAGSIGTSGSVQPTTPSPNPSSPTQSTSGQSTSGQPAPSAESAQHVLQILRDDQRRAALISTLETIVTAQPVDAGLQLAPDSLGAQVVLGASNLLNQVSKQAQETFFAVGDLPLLGRWLVAIWSDSLLYNWLAGVLWRLALVLALGWVGAWLVRQFVRGPHARLAARSPKRETILEIDVIDQAERGALEPAPSQPPRPARVWIQRLPYAVGCLGLDLLPVLVFVILAHALLATPLAGSYLTQRANLAIIHALALWRIGLAMMEALSAPTQPRLRLLPIGDGMARYVMRWTHRIAAIVLATGAVLPAAVSMGMPPQAYAGWLKLASLAIVTGLITIVFQRRQDVARWLRDGATTDGPIKRLRQVLAPFWHWLAVTYVVFLWLVWIAEFGGGNSGLLRTLIATILVLSVARLASLWLGRMLERLLEIDTTLATRYPGLDSRVRGYRPWLRTATGLLVTVVSLIVLLEVWGFAPLQWLTGTRAGQNVLAGFGSIGVTLLLAMMVWELINLGFVRHMGRLAEQAQAARSARLRTLLPMLRTVLLIAIVVVVGLTVLSQIGVNIAPLLAGAGVLGIAIGFGSQKLVQDVITGLFLLLENAMQVGDVVTLGGATGVVEELSIRSIRLRAEDGSVQIIPFSAVTTVTNMTRDFSQAVIELQVDHKNDTDQVLDLLRDIASTMRAEPLWEKEILADLEVMGLVRFEPQAAVIKCRLKCGPFARWKVQREFFRRMKRVLAEHGIEPPSAVQRLVMEAPPAGPGNVSVPLPGGAAG